MAVSNGPQKNEFAGGVLNTRSTGAFVEDHFRDGQADAARMGAWLQVHLDDLRYTFLLSNHDLPYLFPGGVITKFVMTAMLNSITWLDWVQEFVDAPELPPQIVGHTGRAGPEQKGRSWCLDGNQSCYGMLTGGALEVRFLDNVSERREKPRKG